MGEKRPVGMQKRAPGEKRYDTPESKEGGERNAHLARRKAVTGEQKDARDECEDHAREQGDRDRLSERRAHQQRQLDVAHAHSRRIREGGGEQEERGTESSRRPFGARRGAGGGAGGERRR